VRRALSAIIAIAAFTLFPGPAHALAASEPVLGSPDYVQPYGEGFGTYKPTKVFNGGSPGGLVSDINWRGWGKPVARGRGLANIYRPQGNYYPPVRIPLRAKKLGTCPDHPERAYTILLIREPNWPGGPLGPWLKWSGSRDLCDYNETDPQYDYPRQPPGLCRQVGEYGSDSVQSIQAYRLSCRKARRVARLIRDRAWPVRCYQSGCARKVRGLTCHLERFRNGETIGGLPAQRVWCKRRHSTMSAFRSYYPSD
jgi:hypothetical protein